MTSIVPQTFVPGYRLQDGSELNDALANPQWSTATAVTATTGGTASTSVKIVTTITNVTSATAGAGVTLPRTAIGRFFRITNSTLNAIKVYAEGGATINGTAGTAGFTLDAGLTASFYGVDTTAWQTSSSGSSASIAYVSDVVTALPAVAPTTGAVVDVGGYASVGDGGGGQFYGVSGAAPGTYVGNTGTIILPTGGNGSSAWLRIYSGPINVSWFGAKGDGVTNDYLPMYRASLLATAQGVAIELVSGKNYLSSSLFGVTCSILGNGATISGRVLLAASNTFIRDLNIVSPVADYGIRIPGTSTGIFTDVKIENVKISFSGGIPADRLGISAVYVDNLVIDNCSIDYGANLVTCANYRFTNNIVNGNNENTNELLHSTFRSYGLIEGNTFLNSFDNWMDLYSSGERTVVNGNRFDGNLGRLGTGIEIKVTLANNQNNTSGGINNLGYDQYIVFTNNYVGNYVQSVNSASSILNIYYIDERSAAFTGVIAAGTDTKLTVSNLVGRMVIGATLYDGVTNLGVTILSQDSGTTGENGVYTLSGSVVGGLSSAAMNLQNFPFTWAQTPYAIVVSGNIFDGLDTTANGGQIAQGITIATCESVNISNNIFKRMGVGGSHAPESSCVNIINSRNIVVANNIMNFRNGTGVALRHTCDNIQITGNQVINDVGNSYNLSFGVIGVKYGADPVAVLSNITVIGNKLEASLASARMLNTSGSVTYMTFSGNICTNETVFEVASNCKFINNVFGVAAGRFRAFQVGYTGAICAYNLISGNTANSPVSSPKPGMQIVRCRASIVSQNTAQTATFGIQFIGTNTAGELDYLVVKDNFSVSQTQVNFPEYTTMNAADTATLVADTNQKVT